LFQLIQIQNNVIVVRHDRISTDINAENLTEFENAFFDPTPSMFIINAGLGIFTAQKGAPNTAGNAVIVGRGGDGDLSVPWLRHDCNPFFEIYWLYNQH
jgi:hypothetical protein